MRIAVTTQERDPEGEVDPRFGRAKYFLVIDTDTNELQLVENRQNLNLPQGAGIQAAQNLAGAKPDVVLTGNCGPKAFRTLQATGIKVVTGVSGRISEAVQAYLDGKYQVASQPNVEGHWT
ncbi:MAG: NifB/NifX family molybdenum-iron cluster-binding protein [Deltaproteobacteria bacterium]|nr:NifB/NifX family molybdenum-iron cluster-binding protein [Deltaproteobacteria bacterium]MBW2070656.1 NifB/NifX family molybdenum-iron cluster-binding protein [Deltaproteobacteria bacterium]